VFSFNVRFVVLRSRFGSGFVVVLGSGFAGSTLQLLRPIYGLSVADLPTLLTISAIPRTFQRHTECSAESHDTRRQRCRHEPRTGEQRTEPRTQNRPKNGHAEPWTEPWEWTRTENREGRRV